MAETGKSGNSGAKNGKPDVQSRLRRLSSRVAQASSASRKQSAKSQLEELKLENQALKEKLEQETKAKQQIMNTLQSLASRVLEYVDIEELRSHIDSDHLSADVDYSELPPSSVLEMFAVLLEDKFGEDSDHMVTRLEELETRVTEQAQSIAEQVVLRMKLQHRLEELEQCKTICDVQNKIYEMKFSICKFAVIAESVLVSIKE